MTQQEARELILELPEVYLAYSRATNMPYLAEGEEDASDQVFLFSTQEEVKAFIYRKQEEKIPVMGMWHDKKTFPHMLMILVHIGVDTVVFTQGEKTTSIPLSFLARQPDFSRIEEAKRPLFNPRLQLCCLYFLQALRSPEKDKNGALIRALEEEVLVNLARSSFLCMVQRSEGENGNIQLPLIKRKDGMLFMPLFTDVMELQKQTKGKPVKTGKVSFGDLPKVLLDQANGFAINPFGFNLVLDRDTLKKLVGKA